MEYKKKHLLSETVSPSQEAEQIQVQNIRGVQKAVQDIGETIETESLKKAKNDFNVAMLEQMGIANKLYQTGMNPKEVETHLAKLEKEMTGVIKSPYLKAEAQQSFLKNAGLTIESIKSDYAYNVKKQAEESYYNKITAQQRFAEDNSQNLFSENPMTAQMQVEEVDSLINAKDADGKDIFTPEQKVNMRSEMYSTGIRNTFDNSSLQQKYSIYNEWKNKRTRLLNKSVHTDIERTDYETTEQYMRQFLKKIKEDANEENAKKDALAGLSFEKQFYNMEIGTNGEVKNKGYKNIEDQSTFLYEARKAHKAGIITDEQIKKYEINVGNAINQSKESAGGFLAWTGLSSRNARESMVKDVSGLLKSFDGNDNLKTGLQEEIYSKVASEAHARGVDLDSTEASDINKLKTIQNDIVADVLTANFDIGDIKKEDLKKPAVQRQIMIKSRKNINDKIVSDTLAKKGLIRGNTGKQEVFVGK